MPAAPQSFPRDDTGSDTDAQMLRKATTDDIFQWAETIAAMKVFPAGFGTVAATLNGFSLTFKVTEAVVTGVLNGVAASGTAWFKTAPAALPP